MWINEIIQNTKGIGTGSVKRDEKILGSVAFYIKRVETQAQRNIESIWLCATVLAEVIPLNANGLLHKVSQVFVL